MTTASTRPPLEIRRTLLSKLMSPHNHRTDRPRYTGTKVQGTSSRRAVIPTVENQGLSVVQLNAEGLTNAKLEVIQQLADSNQVDVVLLQETHRSTNDNYQGFSSLGLSPANITVWQHSYIYLFILDPVGPMVQHVHEKHSRH